MPQRVAVLSHRLALPSEAPSPASVCLPAGDEPTLLNLAGNDGTSSISADTPKAMYHWAL
jgi:hypothetical protein